MPLLKRLGSAALEVTALSVAAGLVTVALNAGSAGPSNCVAWSTETKMDAYGFDHFVNLESKCPVAVACDITSSTNPQTVHANVKPGEKQRVLVWRGSPARELSAEVTCSASR